MVQWKHAAVQGWEGCQEGAQEMIRGGDDAKLPLPLGEVATVWYRHVKAQAAHQE